MATADLSPDAQLQYDELVYGFRSRLADCDADDAVDTLDELLTHHRQQVLAAARTLVAALPTANDGSMIGCTRTQILDAITAGGAR